ncbi:quinone oxidoreductase [Klebsiella oxytoca]|nr:quinone oxidoreductase [Klebsiella oxytoca]
MATRIEFHQHGGPDVLQAVEFTPKDPAEHEIQVENKAIGINYIDTYIRSGLYPPPSLPSSLGTEAAGVVSKVGNGVKHIKAGDRVVYAQSALGAYSSVHNVPADKAAILPDAISFEQAAASFLKGLTVYYLLRKTYEIKAGEPFLFHAAAGGVGLIACQWAKALGAKLIGTVGSAQKAERAKQAGAWQIINYREENIVERLKEITDGKKVQVVYDSVGKDTWEASLDCLQRRGADGELRQLFGPGDRRESRHSQPERFAVRYPPVAAGLYHYARRADGGQQRAVLADRQRGDKSGCCGESEICIERCPPRA